MHDIAADRTYVLVKLAVLLKEDMRETSKAQGWNSIGLESYLEQMDKHVFRLVRDNPREESNEGSA